MTEATRAKAIAAVLGLVGLVLLVLRFALAGSGAIRSPTTLAVFAVTGTAGIVSALIILLRTDVFRRLEHAGVVLAVGASLLALVAQIAPEPQAETSVLACADAKVRGVAYLARTVPGGANAREGPSRGFPPVFRFDGSCSVGFDGYCLGEAIPDSVLTDRFDVRWLAVSGKRRALVSAGALLGQSPEDELEPLPSSRCGRDVLHVEPVRLIPARAEQSGKVRVTATGNVPTIGYAIYLGHAARLGLTNIRAIGNAPPGKEAPTWKAHTSAASLPGMKGTAVLLAAPCLGVGVPDPDPQHYATATYNISKSGAIPRAEKTRLPDRICTRLAYTACQE